MMNERLGRYKRHPTIDHLPSDYLLPLRHVILLNVCALLLSCFGGDVYRASPLDVAGFPRRRSITLFSSPPIASPLLPESALKGISNLLFPFRGSVLALEKYLLVYRCPFPMP